MQTIARSMADTGPMGGRYMPHAPPIVGRYGKAPAQPNATPPASDGARPNRLTTRVCRSRRPKRIRSAESDDAGIALNVGPVRREVVNVQCILRCDDADDRNVRMIAYVNHNGFPLPQFGISSRRPVPCDHAIGISFEKEQIAAVGLAEARCLLQHRLEYGLQFAGRTADHLENLG